MKDKLESDVGVCVKFNAVTGMTLMTLEHQLFGAMAAMDNKTKNNCHDANLNALFAALRTQIMRSLELVTPGNGRWDHELYRKSLVDELRIEAEIIKYVVDKFIADAVSTTNTR